MGHPGREPLSANSNMRPLQGAKTGGQELPYSRHAPRQKSENLSKDQFGVLAKGTLRKLYSRIEAPWPELIEGALPSIHQMLNERRELHKIAQQATHLLSIHCLYQTPAGSARGFVKKVDEGGSWAVRTAPGAPEGRIFAGFGMSYPCSTPKLLALS